MTRPKELRPPTRSVSSPVIIQDRVWYLPTRADVSQFHFPGWTSTPLFEREAPVCVEYCSGNGAWIAEKARLFPQYNWLAVEKRFDRTRKIWSKIKNGKLTNLVVACAEGFLLSKSFFPSSSIHSIFVNFPDPWPKRRHEKHRIISLSFLQEVSRTLIDGGRFIFVTDDEPYSSLFIDLLDSRSLSLTSVVPLPFYQAPPEGYGTSFFDTLFTSQGKCVRYHELQLTKKESFQ